jgi:lauroyl/myristoyl acyltransferase
VDLESLRYLYLRRCVVPVLSAMPFRWLQALTCMMARGVHSMNTPGRRRAEARIARLADSWHVPTAQIIEQMYVHMGRFWAEAIFVRRRLGESTWRRHVSVVNEAKFDSLRTGCIVATACHGNPAACAMALGQLFRPIHVLVDSSMHPILSAWQRDMLSIPNVQAIERREAAHHIPRILADGGAVMMLCDSPRAHGKCVPMSFLGGAFRCQPTLGRLARWFNVPIGVVTCRRSEKPFSFELHLHETIRAGREDSADDLTRRAMSAIERVILEEPAQYLWSLPSGDETLHMPVEDSPRYAYGNLIGVVPKNTSKSVGLAKAVSGGQ